MARKIMKSESSADLEELSCSQLPEISQCTSTLCNVLSPLNATSENGDHKVHSKEIDAENEPAVADEAKENERSEASPDFLPQKMLCGATRHSFPRNDYCVLHSLPPPTLFRKGQKPKYTELEIQLRRKYKSQYCEFVGHTIMVHEAAKWNSSRQDQG
eukprot:CAMPEP_0113664020 /NCGR_PEP_ID=MMETSP0038_2-20120614/1488_1 /TAXON_ID=2898 /ORGANISM="Cryptomonas paramecium" /LENGTH=157 /DNA_ID=CAMNT_0000579157 /DNA_START=21 /DNA_END=494 /DNA_ORIENTATION=+ /assembly_acc=CAM_ASM_000170